MTSRSVFIIDDADFVVDMLRLTFADGGYGCEEAMPPSRGTESARLTRNNPVAESKVSQL